MGVTKTEINLIPWDPESPAHVERLYEQRIACGWNKDQIPAWKDLQREGKMAIQWILLSSLDAQRESMISQHIKAYPKEKQPISDSALSFGGKPRIPSSSPGSTFIPIGHISLDSESEDPTKYKISTFYVSSALQGKGIGRAAMDAVESMATAEPLNAKTLWLYTAANDNFEDVEKTEALEKVGIKTPAFTNQDWYQRRGYEIYDRRERMWSHADAEGRDWWSAAVFMKKAIE